MKERNRENENEDARRMQRMKNQVLRKGMTSDARERLGSVRFAKPQLASQAESVCIQLIQQGRRVDEETLKKVLSKLSSSREISIRRR